MLALMLVLLSWCEFPQVTNSITPLWTRQDEIHTMMSTNQQSPFIALSGDWFDNLIFIFYDIFEIFPNDCEFSLKNMRYEIEIF